MKKLLAGALSATLALGALPAFAEEDTTAATPQILYNNAAVETPVTPEIVNDRVLVPFRSVLEHMGATVTYNHETRDVSAARGDRTISFNLNGDSIAIDDAGTQSTAPIEGDIVLSKDYTLMPLRSMSEALGMSVGWDNAYRTVVIVDTEQYIADLNASTPNFSKLMAMQTELPKSYQSALEFKFAFDLGYEENGAPKAVNLALDITANSSAKDGVEAADIDMKLDLAGLQEAIAGVDLSKLTDIQMDCISNESDIYIKTNLLEKLAAAAPEEQAFQTAASFCTPETWMKIDLNTLMGLFGFDETMAPLLQSASSGQFTEQMLGQLLETAAMAQTGGADSIVFAQTVDVVFKAYEILFSDKYTTITDKGENSYDVAMTMDSAAFRELMQASLNGLVTPEELPKLDFNLKVNESVVNGVPTVSTFEMTMGMKNSETEKISMTFNGSASMDTQTAVADIQVPSTALNIADLLGALGIISDDVN